MKGGCGNGYKKQEKDKRMHAAACIRAACGKCGSVVVSETDRELRKEYPYYCPCCNENMYSSECIDSRAAVLQETPAAEYSWVLEK